MASTNSMNYRKLKGEKAGLLWSFADVESRRDFLVCCGGGGPYDYLQRYNTFEGQTPEARKARESFNWLQVYHSAAYDVVACLERVRKGEEGFDSLPKLSSVEPERHEEGELLSGWKSSASFRLDGAVSTCWFESKSSADCR
jgi:hypothetical protein